MSVPDRAAFGGEGFDGAGPLRLVELPGDLLERCLWPLGVLHLQVCERVNTVVKEAATAAQSRVPQLCALRDLVGEQAVFGGAAGAALAAARESGQGTSSVMACRHARS